jgi:hypothetical protein
MSRKVPETLAAYEFSTIDGKCVTKLRNGRLVELPSPAGELDPARWHQSTIEYVDAALRALEDATIEFTVHSGYLKQDASGREAEDKDVVTFPISQTWRGWGKQKVNESGEAIFTLFGSYH